MLEWYGIAAVAKGFIVFLYEGGTFMPLGKKSPMLVFELTFFVECYRDYSRKCLQRFSLDSVSTRD